MATLERIEVRVTAAEKAAYAAAAKADGRSMASWVSTALTAAALRAATDPTVRAALESAMASTTPRRGPRR